MAVKPISDADKGWLAAIIDAKGQVNIKNNKTRINSTPQVVLRIQTTDRRIADRLETLTGTKPQFRDSHPEGRDIDFLRKSCKEHCPEAHVHVVEEGDNKFPDAARWTLTGAAMGIVLWNIRTYMATYSEYVPYMGMVFGNMVTSGQGSGQVRASVRRLRDLGWRIPAKVERDLRLNEESAAA